MTRLFRLAACTLATTILASACVGNDPVSPTIPAPSLTKVQGDTLNTTTTESSAGSGCTASDSSSTGSDSTATGADSTNTCFGDILPWARGGDILPWARK